MARRDLKVNSETADWVILAREKSGWYVGGQFGDRRGCDITSPEDLRNAAILYFDWAESMPVAVGEMVKAGPLAGEVFSVPRHRVFSLSGLATYLGIGLTRLNNICKKSEYVEVKDWIDTVIRTQKFELAAAGAADARFLSREMGLDNSSSALPPSTSLNIEVRSPEAAGVVKLLQEKIKSGDVPK